MDVVRLITSVIYAYFIISYVSGINYIWVDIALYVVLLITVVYATEVNMALSGARIWYNVMVVSVAMSIPQTVFAIKLSIVGKPVAAWIDTLGSTLVDAILVTAVVRRHVIGSYIVRAPVVVGYLLLWSILAVGLNVLSWYPQLYSNQHVALFYAVVGLTLPFLLVRGNVHGLPSKSDMLMLVNNAFATLVASYMLSDAVSQLQLEQVHLGVVSLILATLPDFIVGVVIRGVVAKLISSEAGDQEMVYTMLASATHDQLTIPGMIMLFAPAAMVYYPHIFNLLVVALKFTILDRRAYWFIGVPGALLALAAPPV